MTIFVLEEQNQKLLFASEEEAQRSKIAAEKEYEKMGWNHYWGEIRMFDSAIDNFDEDNYEDGINKNVPLEFGNEGAKKCKRIARKIHRWWREKDYDWDNYDFEEFNPVECYIANDRLPASVFVRGPQLITD